MSLFHSQPRVEFINGNTWLLLEDFTYDSDRLKRSILIPAGFITDFNSIPVGLWNLLPKAKYGQAAVVHDFLCTYGRVLEPPVSRKEADAVFKEALEVLGAGKFRRWIMYSGVRIGSLWSKS